jgi:hypothetical protein
MGLGSNTATVDIGQTINRRAMMIKVSVDANNNVKDYLRWRMMIKMMR